MRKLFVGILVSCVMLNGIVACAGETESGATELKWEDFVALNDAADEDIISQGDFVTFDEIACQMWVPNVMKAVELTDEDVEAGYIGYFSTEDEENVAAVMYVDVDGMDLDGYIEYLAGEDDVEEVARMTINGLPAVSYDMPEKDTTCVAFETEAGYILEFSFAPMSDENYQGIIAFMGGSIQPADVEESTEA